MRPLTDLAGARPKGTNPYLPTGLGRIKSVSWCELTDENGTALLNKEGKPFSKVLALQLEGEDKFFRVPRLTARYTETLTPVLNSGDVLDMIRQALDTTSTYEEVVSKLDSLIGKSISVTRTPQKLVTTDLKPYVGSVVKVEFVKEQAQPQTPAAPAAAAQP